MRQSGKKMTRGQMIYAPISASERVGSKSPFGKGSAKSLVKDGGDEILQHQEQQQKSMQMRESVGKQQQQIKQQSVSRLQQQQQQRSPMSQSPSPPKQGKISTQKKEVYQPQPQHPSTFISSPKHPHPSPYPTTYPQIAIQLSQLTKQNQLLRSRQQIYISKLLKLQQGLNRQHEQFMNLQQLYTQLFNVYKQKQQQFAELEMKYKQTERSYANNGMNGSGMNLNSNTKNAAYGSFRQQQQSFQKNSLQSQQISFTLYQQAFKQQLSQLIYQNKRLNETNQKLITQLNYLKSKHNLQSSKQFLQAKFINEIQDTQKLLQKEKQNKLQLQYQNKYLQMRTQDLEKTILQLENIITLKQSEIIKIREEKINVRRQSSQKVLQNSNSKRSPPRQQLDSSRSKTNMSNTQKKYSKLIQNLQKQNDKLREENLLLKERINKGNRFLQQPAIMTSSRLQALADSNHHNNTTNNSTLTKKLNFTTQQQQPFTKSYSQKYQNENFNSQNINEQYFSFSREQPLRDDKLFSQEDMLPTFPMDLEIQGLIKRHQQQIGYIQNKSNLMKGNVMVEPQQQQREVDNSLQSQQQYQRQQKCSVS